ncbi:MAG: hypothetical protein JSR48_00565 [Verrucomicrobia bacterium]|nr:hypothetical protein [Verrucomicrobiota bacterium]
MIAYPLVVFGGDVGSVLRNGLTASFTTRLDGPFSWGAFVVNITDSVASGVIGAWFGHPLGTTLAATP